MDAVMETNDTSSVNGTESLVTQDFTDAQLTIANTISNIFCVVSIFSCVMILIVYIVGRSMNRNMVLRVSLQLTMVQAVFEIIANVGWIWSNEYRKADIVCGLSVWFIILGMLMSVFIPCCMVINLKVAFLFNRRFQNLKWWYIGVSLVISLICATLPLAFGILGWDVEEETCWYAPLSDINTFRWKWATLYGPMSVAILYTAIGVALIITKLVAFQRRVEKTRKKKAKHAQQQQRRRARASRRQQPPNIPFAPRFPSPPPIRQQRHSAVAVVRDSPETPELNADDTLCSVDDHVPAALYQGPETATEKVVKMLVPRVLCYPLVPLICQLPIIIDEVLSIQDRQTFASFLIGYITPSLQGLFTAIVFFTLDPTWYRIRKELVAILSSSSSPSSRRVSILSGGRRNNSNNSPDERGPQSSSSLSSTHLGGRQPHELDTVAGIEAALPHSQSVNRMSGVPVPPPSSPSLVSVASTNTTWWLVRGDWKEEDELYF
ncbi:hypothetical protein HK102_007333 [Quaeritorhiza haematococci]|nr:hypothetical protein HK102_007333 [Quaeritorhiza haematococci]